MFTIFTAMLNRSLGYVICLSQNFVENVRCELQALPDRFLFIHILFLTIPFWVVKFFCLSFLVLLPLFLCWRVVSIFVLLRLFFYYFINECDFRRAKSCYQSSDLHLIERLFLSTRSDALVKFHDNFDWSLVQSDSFSQDCDQVYLMTP